MKGRFTTGMVIGSLLGASATMFMDMDKRQMKKVKKKINNMQSMLKM